MDLIKRVKKEKYNPVLLSLIPDDIEEYKSIDISDINKSIHVIQKNKENNNLTEKQSKFLIKKIVTSFIEYEINNRFEKSLNNKLLKPLTHLGIF